MSSKAKFAEHHGDPFLVSASDSFLESVPDYNTPESIYAEKEEALKNELARVLSRLPPKEAEALGLWVSGLTQQQIADRDGVTQAAVSIRAKKGLERLFKMRDSGEISTLKGIWDGFHVIKTELAEIDGLEKTVDLGESVGSLPEIVDMTDGEVRVLDALDNGPLHLNQIAASVWPNDDRRYSWTRNALRKLVKFGFVRKVGKGRYEATND